MFSVRRVGVVAVMIVLGLSLMTESESNPRGLSSYPRHLLKKGQLTNFLVMIITVPGFNACAWARITDSLLETLIFIKRNSHIKKINDAGWLLGEM
jgi:hypothetical protein